MWREKYVVGYFRNQGFQVDGLDRRLGYSEGIFEEQGFQVEGILGI